jgi:mRNA-degrading endonuclease toxin of MazEF toxin-antitoxin module
VSAEQGNKFSDSVVVAALTSRIPEKAYPVNVALAGGDPLPDRGLVLCRSLFTLPKEKLESFRANLRPEQMAQVDRALSIALALPRPPPAEWPPPAE